MHSDCILIAFQPFQRKTNRTKRHLAVEVTRSCRKKDRQGQGFNKGPGPWMGQKCCSPKSPFRSSSSYCRRANNSRVLLEDSNLEKINLVQEVHTSWWLWARLMKQLDSEAFYSLSGTIPAVFLISSGHSCCILSTFEVHFTYLRCILFEFLKVRTELGDLSGSVLNHSRRDRRTF